MLWCPNSGINALPKKTFRRITVSVWRLENKSKEKYQYQTLKPLLVERWLIYSRSDCFGCCTNKWGKHYNRSGLHIFLSVVFWKISFEDIINFQARPVGEIMQDTVSPWSLFPVKVKHEILTYSNRQAKMEETCKPGNIKAKNHIECNTLKRRCSNYTILALL